MRRRDIAERDWKRLRVMHGEKLEQFSRQVLGEIEPLIEVQDGGAHAAYLEVWDRLQARDRKMSELFDNPRRSIALFMLASWRASHLLTDDELRQFGEETQNEIALLSGE